MATGAPGSAAPPKPWERAGSSGPSPFRPATASGSTSAVVESSGVSNSDEKPDVALANQAQGPAQVGRPMPPRPWERNTTTGYNSMTNYNQQPSYGYGSPGYGSGMYGSSYGSSGMYGNTYGSGMHGNNVRGYGLGSPYGGGGLYGGGYGMGNSYGGAYGNGYNSYGGGAMGAMGGYGMGGPGGPFDPGQGGDPNDPFSGGPAAPPTFWQSMLRVMHGVVNFLGRVSFLVDQNTQAFHFFITALLQLCDRAGLLYGELARFVLRLLGVRTKPRLQPGPPTKLLPGQKRPGDNYIEQRKAGGDGGGWDNVWSDDVSLMPAE